MKPKIPQNREWWKPVLLIGFLVCFFVLVKILHLGDQVEELEGWVRSLGAWGPVVFAVIYAMAVVAALPATLFAFMAGVLFGTWVGVLVANLGATVGACLAFLIGRYFARATVHQLVGKNKNFKKLDMWTASNGNWIVILTRLFPLLPFNLLNYAFGLTRIDFWPYAFWTWLCMIPALLVYVGGADAVHQGLSRGRVPWSLAGLIAGVVVFLILLGSVLKRRTRKLR
jgi:uncharacterized membrane protein YdjX (TVP38/TMEM64 family)